MSQNFKVKRGFFCPPRLGSGKRFRCCKVDYSNRTFLGLDLSTQKLKAVIVNSQLQETFSHEVKFDIDLPEFKTDGGVNHGDVPNEYSANPTMWVKALDIVLNCLKTEGADMSTIAAVSGSAQQHGSVYWSHKGYKSLCGLMMPKRLHEQIDETAFTTIKSPVWMDSSTETECREMEKKIGSPSEMAAITGSKCYARFTGPQIRKFEKLDTEAYEKTIRISLISSFLASLFLGNIAPIDYSDGSGMNLFDIRKKVWSQSCLDACAPNLRERLLEAVPTTALLGCIHKYFVQRWNFRPDCMIVACTGDNPSALAGMLLSKNSLVVSLGTSDTILLQIKDIPTMSEGHVLCHPIETNEFMGLLCFKNGSLVRETICKEVAGGNWDKFNKMLSETKMGNEGNMALHFHDMEIIPLAKGILRWDSQSDTTGKGIEAFARPEIEVRALIEGQMLHHRAIATDMGFSFGEDTKIIATGGASVNKHILQVLSDVFNAPVYTQTSKEAALMGAAYRARYAFYFYRQSACNCANCNKPQVVSYAQFISSLLPDESKLVCSPNLESQNVYSGMISRYQSMAQVLISQQVAKPQEHTK